MTHKSLLLNHHKDLANFEPIKYVLKCFHKHFLSENLGYDNIYQYILVSYKIDLNNLLKLNLYHHNKPTWIQFQFHKIHYLIHSLVLRVNHLPTHSIWLMFLYLNLALKKDNHLKRLWYISPQLLSGKACCCKAVLLHLWIEQSQYNQLSLHSSYRISLYSNCMFQKYL